MLVAIVFAACFVLYGTNGKALDKPNEKKLPCHFNTYDLDSNGEITMEEFLAVTRDFTQIDSKTLFGRLDTNGDGRIVTDDFTHMDSSLVHSEIFQHCQRLRCVFLCFW